MGHPDRCRQQPRQSRQPASECASRAAAVFIERQPRYRAAENGAGLGLPRPAERLQRAGSHSRLQTAQGLHPRLAAGLLIEFYFNLITTVTVTAPAASLI